MAISAGSIIRFKLFQRMREQQCLNVFYYAVLAVDPGGTVPFPGDLARGWGQRVYAQLRPLQSNQWSYDRVEVDEVNGTAIGSYIYPDASVGAVVAASLPPMSAISCQLVRSDRTTRHGWKRFGGVPETATDNGVVTPALAESWRSAIANFILPTTVPPVPRFDLIDADDTPYGYVDARAIIWGGNSPSFPTGRYQFVSALDVKPNITTQNTRKVGRGM